MWPRWVVVDGLSNIVIDRLLSEHMRAARSECAARKAVDSQSLEGPANWITTRLHTWAAQRISPPTIGDLGPAGDHERNSLSTLRRCYKPSTPCKSSVTRDKLFAVDGSISARSLRRCALSNLLLGCLLCAWVEGVQQEKVPRFSPAHSMGCLWRRLGGLPSSRVGGSARTRSSPASGRPRR